MTYQGSLILRERLARNWSQQGLCQGICTVSYLSKIETGKTEPSPEILRLLLGKLGLHTDEVREREAAALAEQGIEALFYGSEEELQELCRRAPDYHSTAAGLELQLLEQVSLPEGKPLDCALESCMSPRMLALQRVLQKRQGEAVLLYPCGWTYFTLGGSAYETGDAAAAVEYLQTGCELAAQEGAPRLMLLCRLLLGNTYSNLRDIPQMEKHYAVARRLARALGDEAALCNIDYNTAAVQLECGAYQEAYEYLSTVKQPGMMVLHKLAIACEKTGRKEEGLAALEQAETMECVMPPTAVARKLCRLVRYRLEHPDYLEKDGYGQLMQECFACCRKELPHGYAVFHLPWMLEWLTATRQYKKAYELLQNFPDS